MLLGFTEQIDGRQTGFVRKILAGLLTEPTMTRGRDFDYYEPEYLQAADASTSPKIHTIRVDKNQDWHPGRSIQFSTGIRTKRYRQFAVGVCKGVQEITMRIGPTAGLMVAVDGHVLSAEECNVFARNDGFDSWHEFCQWFEPTVILYGGRKQYRLIHWTDLRYGPSVRESKPRPIIVENLNRSAVR